MQFSSIVAFGALALGVTAAPATQGENAVDAPEALYIKPIKYAKFERNAAPSEDAVDAPEALYIKPIKYTKFENDA